MELYKCIIIDDESYAIDRLRDYISSIPNLLLIKSYTNPLEALIDMATSEVVDIIFLDINMPQITGIELSREIRVKTRKLVFTTAHTQYGYEAFEVNADAYLLKPYTLSKFASTVAKLFPKKHESPKELIENDDFFFIKDKNDHLKIVKIIYGDVIAVESKLNYVLIHTSSKKVLAYMALTDISKIFREFKNFVQFQRSFILNKRHIDSIAGNTVKMTNGLEITVGEKFREDFILFLSEKLIKTGRKKLGPVFK